MKENQLIKNLSKTSALIGATTAASSAATVQITLTGNILTNTTAMDFNGDVTGDGIDDLGATTNMGTNVVSMDIAGSVAIASYYVTSNLFYAAGPSAYASAATPQTISDLIPVTFTDSRINGGVATSGFLDVTATNTSITEHSITLTRLIFDEMNPAAPTGPFADPLPEATLVPEPSSLGLLALGAGGLAARRRRKNAA